MEPLTELTPEAALRAGGWHPAYARVLRLERLGDAALVLVDCNGDGTEIDVDVWARTSGGWQEGASGGIGGGDGDWWAAAWTGGLAYAVGRARGRSTVVVEHRGLRHEVPVDDAGYWVHLAGDPTGDEPLPRLRAEG